VIAPRLRAEGATKRFPAHGGAVTVLDRIDLELGAGELVVVTGPSLSGKTTLIDLLAGWSRPDAGSVTWDGSADTPPWSHLTVIPQGFALIEELSVVENVLAAFRFAGAGRGRGRGRGRHDDDGGGGGAGGATVSPEGLAGLLERLGLGRLRDRGAFEISVGERQRTMVARALAGRPALILADEPVAHQDQRHADVVLDLLRERVADGAGCVLATRAPGLADRADRVVSLAARA
jgi:putative ABC transport system ATP-binding protein